jgi:hypothetical protein
MSSEIQIHYEIEECLSEVHDNLLWRIEPIAILPPEWLVPQDEKVNHCLEEVNGEVVLPVKKALGKDFCEKVSYVFFHIPFYDLIKKFHNDHHLATKIVEHYLKCFGYTELDSTRCDPYLCEMDLQCPCEVCTIQSNHRCDCDICLTNRRSEFWKDTKKIPYLYLFRHKGKSRLHFGWMEMESLNYIKNIKLPKLVEEEEKEEEEEDVKRML